MLPLGVYTATVELRHEDDSVTGAAATRHLARADPAHPDPPGMAARNRRPPAASRTLPCRRRRAGEKSETCGS